MYVLNRRSDSQLHDMLSLSHAPGFCGRFLVWAPTSEVAVPASGAPAQHCIARVHGLAQPNQRPQHALVRARRRYRSRSLRSGCSPRLCSKQARVHRRTHRWSPSRPQLWHTQLLIELFMYVQRVR